MLHPRLKSFIEKKGGKLLSKYINSVQKLDVMCGKGHIWRPTFSNLQRNGELIIDYKNLLGSRGANLHKSLDCLNWAIKTKAFYKALKFSGALNTSQVLNEFSSEVP